MQIGPFDVTEPVPELKDPHLIAVLRPWIDVGSVGTLALNRVERHLRAKEVARLATPGLFYDYTRYRPRSYFNEGRREVSIPNTVIRWGSREEGPDLLLMHLLEPHLYGEDFTGGVIEVLKHFGVKRYSLVGAMYDMVPHTRPLVVSGIGNGGDAEEERRRERVRTSDYEGPTTITYLITQEAIRLGVETRTFVVHLPQYLQVDEDLTGTARLMQILCSVYGLPARLIEANRGEEQYRRLQDRVDDKAAVDAMLGRLEERYDLEYADLGQEPQEEPGTPPALSQDIEDFLKDLNEGFTPPS